MPRKKIFFVVGTEFAVKVFLTQELFVQVQEIQLFSDIIFQFKSVLIQEKILKAIFETFCSHESFK